MNKATDLEQHIEGINDMLRRCRRYAVKLAAQENLSVVPSDLLEAYEKLTAAVEACLPGATMTRDYADVRERGDRYNGKRYLIRREEGGQVARALSFVKASRRQLK